MSGVPLVSDLIPRRRATFAWILAAGVGAIALLGVLYELGRNLGAATTDGSVAAFDLDSEGSIACWLSVVILLCSAVAALVARTVRTAAGCSRGERRAWLAISVFWCLMSLDEGASLHEGFKELVARLTGTRILGDGSIYWVVPYFGAFSAIGCFLLFHGRREWPAVLCLFTAALCYGLAISGQLDLWLRGHVAIETWLEESCEMLGDLLMLLVLGLIARREVVEIERTEHEIVAAGRTNNSESVAEIPIQRNGAAAA